MAALAPSHGLIESKTNAPRVRPGSIRRNALIRRLDRSGAKRLVSVAAPAGYGKTTLLAQWASDLGQPLAWVNLDERDNDPVLLLRYVLASLDRAGLTVGPEAHPAPPRVRRWARLLPEVARSLRDGRDQPPVVVLDDVHLLSGESLDVVEALARLVPDGGRLVLSGREEITSVVAHHRASGDVLELHLADLALTEQETAALLDAAGANVDDDAVPDLYRRTEGWAAGLYLTVLALETTGAPPSTGVSLDRFVDDYFRNEHLRRLPDDQRSFLGQSAALGRMSAELCDAVLERRDSQTMLETIEQSNLFVVPLDHERTWYRYHDLFRRALLGELERSDPGRANALRRRAADWYEAHDLLEDAMEYAIAAGDTDAMARLLTGLAFPLYRDGRMATALAWLQHFEDGDVLTRYPAVAAVGSLAHALVGRPFQAERWLDAGRSAAPSGPLADGSSSVRPWLDTVAAMLCRDGPEQMRSDAEAALAELGQHSPLRPPAAWLRATALHVLGDPGANAMLADAVDEADAGGATMVCVAARAQRALLALDRGDAPLARELADGAYHSVEHASFDDYTPMALLLAADARVALAEGEPEQARSLLTGVQRIRPELSYAIPFISVTTLVAAARAYLDLGDVTGARSLLADARDLLRHRPRLGALVGEVEDLGRRVAAAAHGGRVPASGLTPAELRLLPLLTTHLTFAEIGERLFVSRNTVKTQAISLYRKLDASSRGEAVRKAEEVGLVDTHLPDPARITPSG